MEEGFMLGQQTLYMICLKPLVYLLGLACFPVNHFKKKNKNRLLSNLKWEFSFHSETVWVLFSVLLCVSYVSSASLFVFSSSPFSLFHTLWWLLLLLFVVPLSAKQAGQAGWAGIVMHVCACNVLKSVWFSGRTL